MKVSEKIYGIIFSLLISLVMSFFMSFFMIWVNVGFTNDFMVAWMGSTVLGLIIGFPIAAIAVPLIQRLLGKYLTIKE